MKRLLFSAALLFASHASVAALTLPGDGWASWEVQAAEGARNLCCMQWRGGPVKNVVCDLDGRNDGYGSTSRDERVSTMRVYARFTSGKVEKLRTLGPACEVKTQTPIRDLGTVSPAESERWLAAQLPNSAKHLDDVLASLSVHHGAAHTLIRIATTDENPKARSQAWFWLAQARAVETESAIAVALKKEPSRKVREQAIFALSQLPGERGAKALAAVAGDTSLPREDRKHAIFWMGQVDSPYAIAYLDRLLGGGK